MTHEHGRPHKRRFMVGVALVLLSYVLWGAMLLFGAFQVRWRNFPWWRLAAGAWALNWVAFLAGIALAGREAVHYVRRKARGMLGKRR